MFPVMFMPRESYRIIISRRLSNCYIALAFSLFLSMLVLFAQFAFPGIESVTHVRHAQDMSH
jgi:hypothetical protein